MTRSIRVSVFLISFYVIAIQAFSQETSNLDKGKGSLNIAYWGELITHPGLTTELELPLFNAKKHHLHWGITVGTYLHPRNHFAVTGGLILGYRFVSEKEASIGLIAGVGYLHTWPHAGFNTTIYSFDVHGTVIETSNLGHPSISPSLYVEFGWPLFNLQNVRVLNYFRLGAYGQFPFNQFMLPHIAIQYGIRLKREVE